MAAISDTILVLHVDDEPDFAGMAATFLEREDERLAIETVASADEGLDRLTGSDFDCIVSDYDMPGKNGIQFFEALRESHPDIPFILFTGKGSEEIASEAISIGVTDYLQKGGTETYEVLANRIVNSVRTHRAETRASSIQRRYQKLIEETSDAIFIVDENGRYNYVSPAVRNVLGYDPDELLGEIGFEYLHPDDLPETSEKFAAALEDPSFEPRVEFRFETRDGSWIWLEAWAHNRLTDPDIEGVVVYARDITARKEHERELEAAVEKFEAIIESSPTAIVGVDEDLIVRIWNPAAERMFGWEETEVVGEPLPIIPDHRFDEFIDRFDDVVNGTRISRLEVTHETKGGDVIHTQVATAPVRTPERESVDVMAVVEDITERKERERELQRQNERLEEFTSVVSHDLRNPLNVARGRLELVDDDCDSEHLEGVARAHERMDALINDLLILAREGQEVTDHEPVDLGQVVEKCWRNVDTADATLVTDTERTIRAARPRLQQLFENLIRNSVEHGGANVTVTIGELGDGFFVEDDGPGIPEAKRHDVFEPGFSTSKAGTGFGLSIVKRVANAHGWDVRATHGPEGGARFEITGVEYSS